MRLAARMIVVVVMVLIGLRAIDSYLTVHRELILFSTDMHRDARLLGRVLEHAIAGVWRSDGPAAAKRLIEEANQQDHPLSIRWISTADVNDVTSDQLTPQQLETLQDGQDVAFESEDTKRGNRYYTYVPVDIDSKRVGYLEMSEVLQDRDAYIRTTITRQIVLAGILLLTGVSAIVLLGVVVIGRPLEQLKQKIERVGEGELDPPLRMQRHDELGVLANGLDDMCERLKATLKRVQQESDARIAAIEQLRHVDRLSTIGRLASGVAHELGTPLNVVAGRASMIADGDLRGDDVIKSALTIRKQADRMTAIIHQLLDFARHRPPRTVRIDLRDIVDEVLTLINCLGHKKQVVLGAEDGQPLFASVDPSQIQQVLTNLIDNALQATPDDGVVEVALRRMHLDPSPQLGNVGEYIVIDVRDHGPGIAERDRAHVFDPFFTTKDVGHGTGLGLSIAWGIVREHGGWIDLETQVGAGSCFSICLPKEANGCMNAS